MHRFANSKYTSTQEHWTFYKILSSSFYYLSLSLSRASSSIPGSVACDRRDSTGLLEESCVPALKDMLGKTQL